MKRKLLVSLFAVLVLSMSLFVATVAMPVGAATTTYTSSSSYWSVSTGATFNGDGTMSSAGDATAWSYTTTEFSGNATIDIIMDGQYWGGAGEYDVIVFKSNSAVANWEPDEMPPAGTNFLALVMGSFAGGTPFNGASIVEVTNGGVANVLASLNVPGFDGTSGDNLTRLQKIKISITTEDTATGVSVSASYQVQHCYWAGCSYTGQTYTASATSTNTALKGNQKVTINHRCDNFTAQSGAASKYVYTLDVTESGTSSGGGDSGTTSGEFVTYSNDTSKWSSLTNVTVASTGMNIVTPNDGNRYADAVSTSFSGESTSEVIMDFSAANGQAGYDFDVYMIYYKWNAGTDAVTWNFKNDGTGSLDLGNNYGLTPTGVQGSWIALCVSNSSIRVFECANGVITDKTSATLGVPGLNGYDFWYVGGQKSIIGISTIDTETGVDYTFSFQAPDATNNNGKKSITINSTNTALQGDGSIRISNITGGVIHTASTNSITVNVKATASSGGDSGDSGESGGDSGDTLEAGYELYSSDSSKWSSLSYTTVSSSGMHFVTNPDTSRYTNAVSTEFAHDSNSEITVDFSKSASLEGSDWGVFIVYYKWNAGVDSVDWTFHGDGTGTIDLGNNYGLSYTNAKGDWIALCVSTSSSPRVFECVNGTIYDVLTKGIIGINGNDFWYAMKQKNVITFDTIDATSGGVTYAVSFEAPDAASNNGKKDFTFTTVNSGLKGNGGIRISIIAGGAIQTATSNDVIVKVKDRTTGAAGVERLIEKLSTTINASNYEEQYELYNQALTAYNALSQTEQANVSNYSNLTACGQAITDYEATIDWAKYTVDAIDELPSPFAVTLATYNSLKTKLDNIEYYYSKVSTADKSKVTNYSTYTDALAKYNTFVSSITTYSNNSYTWSKSGVIIDASSIVVASSTYNISYSEVKGNAQMEFITNFENAGGTWGILLIMIKYNSDVDSMNVSYSAGADYITNSTGSTGLKFSSAKGDWLMLCVSTGAQPFLLECKNGTISKVAQFEDGINGNDYFNIFSSKTDILVETFDTLTGVDINIQYQSYAANNTGCHSLTYSSANTALWGDQAIRMQKFNGDGNFTATNNSIVINGINLESGVVSALEELIDGLTVDLTPSNFATVKTDCELARAVYDKMSTALRALVGNYSSLTACEAAVTQYTSNITAAQIVIDKINELPASITVSNYKDVEAIIAEAEQGYQALTQAQKVMVENKSKLDQAKVDLATVQANVAEQVGSLIDAIPELPITSSNSVAVMNAYNTAKSAYDNLSDVAKTMLDSVKVELLNSIGSAIDAWNGISAADVIALINAIPAVIDGRAGYQLVADACEVARSAYVHLGEINASAQSNVTNLSKLTEMEAKLVTFKVDIDSADAVDALIDAIPSLSSVELDVALLKANEAQNAYNELNDNAKSLVTKLGEMNDKVDAIKAEEVNVAISEIPSSVTDIADTKAKIKAAYALYDALTSDQKALVTNRIELVRKNANVESAESVDSLIAQIPTENITDRETYATIKSAYDTAKANYDLLSDDAKQFVVNYSVIVSTASRLEAKNSLIAQADAVDVLINAIPELTNTNFAEVESAYNTAKTALEALSTEAQELVAGAAKLSNIKNLLDIKVLLIEKAETVVALIDLIPTDITASNYYDAQAKFNVANQAFSNLESEALIYVTNANVLTATSAKFEEFAELISAAEDVDGLILGIGTVVNSRATYNSVLQSYTIANNAYNALSVEERVFVKNSAMLTATSTKLNTFKLKIDKADAVDALIDVIPALTGSNRADVEEALDTAETAYNALATDEKAMVTKKGNIDAVKASLQQADANANGNGVSKGGCIGSVSISGSIIVVMALVAAAIVITLKRKFSK